MKAPQTAYICQLSVIITQPINQPNHELFIRGDDWIFMQTLFYKLKKGKGKGNLFYVKNTGSGCPSLPSQGLMIEVFDIHVKRKKKKKKKDLKTIY